MDLQHGRRSADNIPSVSSRICSSVSAPEDLSPGTRHHKRSALIFHLYLIWKLSVNRNRAGGARCSLHPFQKIRWGIRGLSVRMSQFFLRSRSAGFLLRGFEALLQGGRRRREGGSPLPLRAVIWSEVVFFRGGFQRLLSGERSDGVAARRWITLRKKKELGSAS